jgi:hypothetical protein
MCYCILSVFILFDYCAVVHCIDRIQFILSSLFLTRAHCPKLLKSNSFQIKKSRNTPQEVPKLEITNFIPTTFKFPCGTSQSPIPSIHTKMVTLPQGTVGKMYTLSLINNPRVTRIPSRQPWQSL